MKKAQTSPYDLFMSFYHSVLHPTTSRRCDDRIIVEDNVTSLNKSAETTTSALLSHIHVGHRWRSLVYLILILQLSTTTANIQTSFVPSVGNVLNNPAYHLPFDSNAENVFEATTAVNEKNTKTEKKESKRRQLQADRHDKYFALNRVSETVSTMFQQPVNHSLGNDSDLNSQGHSSTNLISDVLTKINAMKLFRDASQMSESDGNNIDYLDHDASTDRTAPKEPIPSHNIVNSTNDKKKTSASSPSFYKGIQDAVKDTLTMNTNNKKGTLSKYQALKSNGGKGDPSFGSADDNDKYYGGGKGGKGSYKAEPPNGKQPSSKPTIYHYRSMKSRGKGGPKAKFTGVPTSSPSPTISPPPGSNGSPQQKLPAPSPVKPPTLSKMPIDTQVPTSQIIVSPSVAGPVRSPTSNAPNSGLIPGSPSSIDIKDPPTADRAPVVQQVPTFQQQPSPKTLPSLAPINKPTPSPVHHLPTITRPRQGSVSAPNPMSTPQIVPTKQASPSLPTISRVPVSVPSPPQPKVPVLITPSVISPLQIAPTKQRPHTVPRPPQPNVPLPKTPSSSVTSLSPVAPTKRSPTVPTIPGSPVSVPSPSQPKVPVATAPSSITSPSQITPTKKGPTVPTIAGAPITIPSPPQPKVPVPNAPSSIISPSQITPTKKGPTVPTIAGAPVIVPSPPQPKAPVPNAPPSIISPSQIAPIKQGSPTVPTIAGAPVTVPSPPQPKVPFLNVPSSISSPSQIVPTKQGSTNVPTIPRAPATVPSPPQPKVPVLTAPSSITIPSQIAPTTKGPTVQLPTIPGAPVTGPSPPQPKVPVLKTPSSVTSPSQVAPTKQGPNVPPIPGTPVTVPSPAQPKVPVVKAPASITTPSQIAPTKKGPIIQVPTIPLAPITVPSPPQPKMPVVNAPASIISPSSSKNSVAPSASTDLPTSQIVATPTTATSGIVRTRVPSQNRNDGTVPTLVPSTAKTVSPALKTLIRDLILIDADLDIELRSLPLDGTATIDLQQVSNVTLRAVVNDPQITTVEFSYFDPILNMPVSQRESADPFTLAGSFDDGDSTPDFIPAEYLSYAGLKEIRIVAFEEFVDIAEDRIITLEVFE